MIRNARRLWLFAILPVLILCILFPACQLYIPPGQYEFNRSRIVEQPADEVWARAAQWYTGLGFDADSIDYDSGELRATIGMAVRNGRDFCDCGIVRGDTLDMRIYTVYQDIGIHEIAEGKTEITLDCLFYAELDTVDTGGVWMGTFDNDPRWIPCSSLGRYEAEMLDKLEGKLPMFCE